MAERERALITGGAGFLGSHLCDRLLDEGVEVVCMDNLITGSLANIEHLFGRDGFVFVEHDVTNFIHVAGSTRLRSPLRLAGLARSTISSCRSRLSRSAPWAPTRLWVSPRPKGPFLLASTSESYGDPLIHPQQEDYWGNVNPVGPRGVYDEAKRIRRGLTMAYHRHHGVDTRIVRIFNTYGPRMRVR
jgi:dTDP-glucose 4,6-dehydratase